MRIQMTLTEPDEEQWVYFQANVQAEYEIPENATRVCLTFIYGREERHAEMPMGTVVGLLMGLGMVGVTREMRNVLAKLRPVDLPEFLNQARRAADPSLPLLPIPDMVRNISSKEAVELTRLLNKPCEHNSPAVSFEPSQFDGAPPVRTHKDGCQSYGPYSRPENMEPWPFGESEETQANQRAADMEMEDYERQQAEESGSTGPSYGTGPGDGR